MQSESVSALTRGANDSIVCSFPFVRWDACQSCDRVCGGDRTSQLSKIKHRPPATDLSGPKASAESLTPRRINLAVADAVDFQFDFFSFAGAFRLAFSSGT